MSDRTSIFPQPRGLTRWHIVRASAFMLFAIPILTGVGCTAGDRTLGVEANAAATSLTLPVAKVIVRPASVTLAPGATRQFRAILKDAAGTILSGIPVTWKSSNTAVATVTSRGVVKAVKLGTANITATAQGKIGTGKVTVSNVTSGTSLLWRTGLETSVDGMNLTSGTHRGGSVVRFKGVPHSGLYSLKFKTPARAKGRAAAFKRFTWSTGRHVVELWFYLPKGQGSNVGFEVTLEGYSGTEAHAPSISWIKNSAELGWRRWYVTGEAGGGSLAWTYLPGGKGKTLTEGQWHYLRYEADYTLKQHRKLTVDNTVFDLTGIPYPVKRHTSAKLRHATVLLYTTSNTSRTAHVDDIKVEKVR